MMRNHYARLPQWFKMLFVIVMLFCVGCTCICMVDQPRLESEIAEMTTSLETSRQREKKQQAEYDEVAAQLPGVLEELAAIQPEADAAKAAADALRSERDTLRDEENAMTAEMENLNAGIANLQKALDILSED